MKQIRNFGDERTLAYCAFCGGETGTRDHCPSKVFLDKPFPENLPVVAACLACNRCFSLDEEYLACLIACVVAGSTDPKKITRERIAKILRQKSSLRAKINASISIIDGNTVFEPERERVKSVIIKLAQGHTLYELHELVSNMPDDISFFPLHLLTEEQHFNFEGVAVATFEGWPEVGSRAMQRMITGQDVSLSGWIIVQPNSYRYVASVSGAEIEVKIVIGEYLGCVVKWFS